MQISRFLTIVSVSTAILFSSSVSAITVWAGANDPSTISDTAAYTWAYSHGITTMSYGAVNMSGPIQRFQLAKMLSQFYTNVQGKRIVHNPMCDMSRFDDSSSFDAEMNRYIQDICDMGIMGRNGTKTALVGSFLSYSNLSAVDFYTVVIRYIKMSSINYSFVLPKTVTRGDVFRFLMNMNGDKEQSGGANGGASGVGGAAGGANGGPAQ